MKTLPIAAVIPTMDRAPTLRRALESLLAGGMVPAEIIVVDASQDDATKLMLDDLRAMIPTCSLSWHKAERRGAAVQRNQGCALATQEVLWFFDDDIVFEPQSLERLWSGFQSDPGLGGANATIVNQRYAPPGAMSRAILAIMNGRSEATYAGRVLGPAVNLLPEDRDDLPEVVQVQWLNTGCTLYRKAALPDPPFDSAFTGYSIMEDLTLSLRVARRWRLANVRTARIFHDSQPGSHKSDPAALSCMELVNRHYVMTRILERRGGGDYARLVLWEAFQLASVAASTRLGRTFWLVIAGKCRGIRQIIRQRGTENAAGR